jgi:hypothetical protein
LNQLFSDLEQIHLQRLKKEETADLVSLVETKTANETKLSGDIPVSTLLKPEIPIVAPRKTPAQTLDDVLASRQPPSEVAESGGGNIEDLDRELAAHFGEAESNADTPTASIETASDCIDSTAAAVRASEKNNVEAQLESTAEQLVENAPVELDTSRTREERSADRVDSLQVGNWVEFQQGSGKVVRCRLAAIIRATGKYIFVNRAGVKVAENNREGLVKAYLSGELSMLDEGRLFDRALESVIGNLRDMKSRNQ